MSPSLRFNAISMDVGPQQPKELSLFKSLAEFAPYTITLPDLIDRTKNANPLIDQIRATTDKDERSRLKRRLPCVTVSGVFSGGHKAKHMVKHNGLLCIDFDLDDNPRLSKSFDKIRANLQADPFSLLTFRSAGGDGLAVIVRIDPDNHLKAFKALQGYYSEEHNLVVDKACKDVCRLRFISHDPQVHHNPNARVFKRYRYDTTETLDFVVSQPSCTDIPQKKANTPESATINSDEVPISCGVAGTMTPTRAQEIISALDALSPDKYQDWLDMGMAVHSEDPSAQGFKIWCDWSDKKDKASKFSYEGCAKKWNTFTPNGRLKIESLFHNAKEAGWSGPPRSESPMKEAEQSSIEPLPVVNAAEWVQIPEAPRKPILDDVFDEGDLVEVVAPSKTKKSFFTMELGLACGEGGKFLCWDIAEPQEVLIFNLEIKPDWEHRRLNAMAKSRLMQLDALKNVNFCNTRGLNPDNMIESIAATVRHYRPNLVILDPMYMLHDGDENNAQDVKPLIRSFMTMMAETGAAVIFVHHDAKGKAGDRNIRDRGAGSGLTGRAVDTRITLTPHAEEPDLICIDAMPRNFKASTATVASFDGCFKVAEGVEYAPETSHTAKKKKVNKSIDMNEVASQAMSAFKDGDMRVTDFREGFLREKVGLGSTKAKQVLKVMYTSEMAFKSRQYQGGYWIGTREQIAERNVWIGKQKGEV